MSWCRWGSPCWATVSHTFDCDEACDPCPGSSVYVYEIEDGVVECRDCLLSGDDGFAGTEDEMREHLRAHAAAGHHVRPSLLLSAEEYQAQARVMSIREGMDRLYACERRSEQWSKALLKAMLKAKR